MYAGPSPSLAVRWRTPTNGSSAARRSATSPVPSGEASSITSTRSPSRTTPASARTIGSRLSSSLYVGRQTVARTGEPYDRRRGVLSEGAASAQQRPRGPAPASGRPDRARGRRRLPDRRLPPRSVAHPRGRRLGGSARARGPREAAPRDRQDHRAEDRGG